MADINQETAEALSAAERAARELAAAQERAAIEVKLFGQTTKTTQDQVTDAQMKAKYGMESFTKGVNSGADAIFALASAGMSASKAMLDGKKGAAAFNDSLDDMSKAATAAGVALTFLIPGGPLIKGVIAGLTAVTTATLAYAKQANEMADKLYKGYSDLAKSGGAASDGMTGLFNDAKKLGLSMNELGGFTEVIAANSKDLALFGGSVFEGRKKLADMGGALESNRENFIKMGLSMTDVTEGMTDYIRAQRVMGDTNKKTTAELAEGAKKYLYEQDALTKLTGMTRKEQEAAREEIRSQERFAAQLEELRQQGKDKEAKALEDTYLVLRKSSKEAAQGFADVSTGFIGTEAAQKSFMATQGESMRVAEQVKQGQLTAAQAAQQVAKAHGDTATQMGVTMGKVGSFDKTYGSLSEAYKLRTMAESDVEKTMAQIEEDRKKREGEAGKKGDEMLDKQAKLIKTQIDANEATENFIKQGIGPAQDAMIKLAETTRDAAKALNKITGAGEGVSEQQKKQDEANWKKMGLTEKAESGAARGVETIGRGAASVAGLFSDTAGKWISNYVDQAEKSRIESESKYLKKEGRFQAVPPAAPAAKPGAAAPALAPAAGGGGAKPAAGGGGAKPASGGGDGGSTAAPTAPGSKTGPQIPAPKGGSGEGEQREPTDAQKSQGGKGNVKLGPNADVSGLQPGLMDRLAKFADIAGKEVAVNSAFRSDQKQAELWVRGRILKEPGIHMPAAPMEDQTIEYKGQTYNVPGTGKGSLHLAGNAVDISVPGMKESRGPIDELLAQAGLYRPFLPKDPPHVQMLNEGGIVEATPGGVPAIIGEGGRDEAVIPLDGKRIPVDFPEEIKKFFAGQFAKPETLKMPSLDNFMPPAGAQPPSFADLQNFDFGANDILAGLTQLTDSVATESSNASTEAVSSFEAAAGSQTDLSLLITELQEGRKQNALMVSLLEEMVRAQKSNNDISNKLLQVSAN